MIPLARIAILSVSCLALSLVLLLSVQPALAGTVSADSYEPNNSLETASSLPSVATLPDLTIYPAQDVDVYRFLAVPGPLSLNVYATPGLDVELTIYDGSGQPLMVLNDPAGPNASYKTVVATTGYLSFSLRSTTPLTGTYQLTTFNAMPTVTPTLAPTATPQPTATSPYPTSTPTPDLGGKPDQAEPNFSFSTAYRIAPGSEVSNLNFNSGMPGQKDNDFFVMAVKAGIAYTCSTARLGPDLDTNLIVYQSANFDNVLAGNDDEDTQAGKINSRVSFTPAADQDIYLLVGYKYPASEDLRYPGAATYSLLCATQQPAGPAPSSDVAGAASSQLAESGKATPLAIVLFAQPQPTPAPTAVPIKTTTFDVVVAYDSNTDRKADPSEGIKGLIVRVVDTATNQELARGLTDDYGGLHFIVASNHPLRLSIPYLAAAQDFQAGNPAVWIFLVPPANVPGLIP